MRKRDIHSRAHQLYAGDRPAQGPELIESRAAALRAVGEVIYACRVGEHIKIGHTTNLWQRLHSLRATELLGFKPGTWDDEQQMHRELAVWVAKGREYYNAAPPVIMEVNAMRQFCHLEPLPFVDAA